MERKLWKIVLVRDTEYQRFVALMMGTERIRFLSYGVCYFCVAITSHKNNFIQAISYNIMDAALKSCN